MFGGSIFQAFNDDPFFEETSLRMRPFNMADPFGMFERHRAALTGPGGETGRSNSLARRNEMMWPFGRSPFDSMFERFEGMANSPNAHTFSSSTVMSYSNGPDGNPQVYRASQSTRTGPGGVKETRKQVQDSASGIQKMSVGHQIGNKSHTIGKSYNAKTNEEMDTHDFINLDEDEADAFEKEWDQTVHSYSHGSMLQRRPQQQHALLSRPYHSQDYEEPSGGLHKERKKSRKERKTGEHRHHQDHFNSEDCDDVTRTRPKHPYTADMDTQYQHASAEVESDLHQYHHGKPKGLRASKRSNTDFHPGLQPSRLKAPEVGHRSKPPKKVNFPDTDDGFVRKESQHYPSCHSSKKSASNQFS